MQVSSRARGLVIGALAAAVLTTTSAAAPEPVEAASSASQVIAIARAQLGDRWSHGATGPSRFDCSGLVIFAFRQAGLGHIVGDGRYRSGYALYRWFRARGLATRSNPQPGDIVVWGGGSHVGIYIGGGRAVSTLTSGVRVHRVHAVTARFTAYLRTGLSGSVAAAAAPAPAPARNTGTRIRGIPWTYLTTSIPMYLRRGPMSGTGNLAVLPAGVQVLATKVATDRAGRTWYNVWSPTANRSGWVPGWFTTAN